MVGAVGSTELRQPPFWPPQKNFCFIKAVAKDFKILVANLFLFCLSVKALFVVVFAVVVVVVVIEVVVVVVVVFV